MSFAAIGVGVGAAVAGAATSAALKPKAPKAAAFTSLDQQAEQRKAIAGNLAVTPQLQSQARGINTFNQAELDRMYDLASGGYYSRISKKLLENAYGDISGEGVNLRDTMTGTAASNLYRGIAGSEMGAFAGIKNAQSYLNERKLAGENSFTRWLSFARSPTFDITSMFVKPAAIDPQAERNTQVRYANDAARFNYVNDPWNEFQSKTADTFGSALKSYLGGMNFGGNTGGAVGGSNPIWSSPDPMDWSA